MKKQVLTAVAISRLGVPDPQNRNAGNKGTFQSRTPRNIASRTLPVSVPKETANCVTQFSGVRFYYKVRVHVGVRDYSSDHVVLGRETAKGEKKANALTPVLLLQFHTLKSFLIYAFC